MTRSKEILVDDIVKGLYLKVKGNNPKDIAKYLMLSLRSIYKIFQIVE